MADTANTFGSLKPIYKEAYAGKKKRKKSNFDKLRSKLLSNWKPKKVGL